VTLGAHLRNHPKPVPDGVLLGIVTLVIPGFNDEENKLRQLTAFLVNLSPDIPWHVTAFHKDYKMTNPGNTTPEMLIRAAEIGKQEGLRFVYAGNLPGQVGDLENTRCADRQALLIKRFGYLIMDYHLNPEGCCPTCGLAIPGRWPTSFQGQLAAHPFLPSRDSSSDHSFC